MVITTHTLVELPVASKSHSRLVVSVDTVNVVPFDLLDLVHGNVASERHREVIAQRQQFTSLVRQVVDELRVLPILASQSFLGGGRES